MLYRGKDMAHSLDALYDRQPSWRRGRHLGPAMVALIFFMRVSHEL